MGSSEVTTSIVLVVALLSAGRGGSREDGGVEDEAGWVTEDDGVAWQGPVGTTAVSPGTAEVAEPESECPADCDCFNTYETVDCSRRGLSTLPPLHNATRRLYLEDNHIALLDAGLRDAAQLTLLIAERNSLERVDVEESFCGLMRIQELNLAANRIRSFQVVSGTRSAESRCRAPVLKEINLSLNLLTEVPRNLSDFAPNLEILNLSYNEIVSATLDASYAAMTSLRYLDLSRNRIHQLAGDDFHAVSGTGVPLEILSLVECGLVQVDADALADLVNLTSLGLANNPLQQETLTVVLGRIGSVRASGNWSQHDTDPEVHASEEFGCPRSESQLIRLDISEVILANLTVDAVGGFSRLVVLDASYCELQYVDPHLFDCLPDLETLHLEGGRLERLDNLPALRRLRRLHLQENRLTTAVDLSGIHGLESIDISRNRIETIRSHWLSGTRGLQVVNLSHNLITAIEADAFHQVSIMSTLDLSFNRLSEVRRYGLTTVGRLDVSYNTVEKIADDILSGLHHSLSELDLGYNRMTHLQDAVLRDARSLLVLDLRHNYLGPKFGQYSYPGLDSADLSSFAVAARSTGNLFQDLESLESLDLSENGLEEIDCRLMTSIPHLLSLNLRGNRFSDLRYASIACCSPTLMRLDVSANRLNVVDVPSLRGLDRLDELDAADNPFDCSDCRQTLFVRWLNRSAGLRLDRPERLLCAGPPPLVAGPSIFDSAASADCTRASAATLTDSTRRSAYDGVLTFTTVLLGTSLAAVVIVVVLIGVACRYRRLFPRLKSLHCIQHWQVRYREVSDLETTLAAHNPLFHAAEPAETVS